jgi:NADPH-dependent 2,4-dienoyl-CoA reductase/sulfur reductase-like enzyme
MSFPVLTTHQIYHCFFQLGGRLSPIGIRDRMVRGQLLVERVLHAGLIGGPTRRALLVVGAGAAGATVAIAAARRGHRP